MKGTLDEATRREIRGAEAHVAVLRALAQLPDKESRARVLEAATHLLTAETLVPGCIEAAASKVNALPVVQMKAKDYESLQKVFDETAPRVNELLPTASATGAYCMGVVTHMAWKDGLAPPRSLLERAAQCKTVEDAEKLYTEYVELRDILRQ